MSVELDGTPVATSRAARLEAGTVVGPVSPFVERLGASIVRSNDRIVIVRGERRVVARLGRREATLVVSGIARDLRLGVVPTLVGGVAMLPIGEIATALGFAVRYDVASRILLLVPPAPTPIGTFSPQTPAPGPYVTFLPTATTAPTRPLPSFQPEPRRTPILVRGGEPSLP